MSEPVVVDLADVRRILEKLSFPEIDQHSDDELPGLVFNPAGAAGTSYLLATAMERDDVLSPAERLTLANFTIKYATVVVFTALVSVAKLTVLVSIAVGKWVSCAAGNLQLTNVFMSTDIPGLIPLAQYAAARSRRHLPGDENTQRVCTDAADHLAARYPV